LARLEAGRVELHTGPASIRELVDEALETTGILGREKGLSVTVEIPDDLPQVNVDVHRIVRVLTNLTGNAVKFTPRGGAIEVSAHAEPRRAAPGVQDGRPPAFVRVTVRDTGQGIPPEELSFVFDRFYRGANEGSVEGTGLGLAIAKEIVERLGGEIWVESVLHRGTAFHFTLPVIAGRADATGTAPPSSVRPAADPAA
jgi:signal transduction histidine kinase